MDEHMHFEVVLRLEAFVANLALVLACKNHPWSQPVKFKTK